MPKLSRLNSRNTIYPIIEGIKGFHNFFPKVLVRKCEYYHDESECMNEIYKYLCPVYGIKLYLMVRLQSFSLWNVDYHFIMITLSIC